MIALGSNVHIFARPHRRGELARCFETILGSPVRTVELPGIDQPMLVVSFPAEGISASSSPAMHPMTSSRVWAPGSSFAPDDPAAAHRAALQAGLTEVKHPGHPYYFMIPGGQVFTIAPRAERGT
jgi:hypothetical protein